jgi:hypothetical protein
LADDDAFFFFGACVTRVIERSFRTRGLTVLSTPLAVPKSEVTHGASVVSRVVLPVMIQELRWAFGLDTFPSEVLIDVYGLGRWTDTQLPVSFRPVSRERAFERRADLERYFRRIADATVVFVELSITDYWFDRETGLALMDVMPAPSHRYPDRFDFRMCGYDEVRRSLLELREILLRFSRASRLVLIVNPMPSEWSYRGGDPVVADTYQKSVLRAVAEDLAGDFPDVAYAPIFEGVVNRPERSGFAEDRRHVRDDVLDEETASMLRTFGIDRNVCERDFEETAYLHANPEVAALVTSGAVASGYHHWIAHGRAAGYPLVSARVRNDVPIERDAMRVRISAKLPATFITGESIEVEATVANRGSAIYGNAGDYPIYVCYRWHDERGDIVDVGHFGHELLEDAVGPGETARVLTFVRSPKAAGSYTFSLSLLQHNVAWFDDVDPANGFRREVVVEDRGARG